MGFYGGYPITPSTEIAEELARRLPQAGGVFIQMEDEIGSIAAVIGASVAGLKAMTATSGPGFSLMQENIGYAAMAEIPCVIVNVQRSGPSTGLPTSPSQADVMQARWGTHGDHPIIALSPSSVLEAYLLTVRAFNLAEQYRTPVILLMDEVVGHLRENVALPGPEEIEIANRAVPAAEDLDKPAYAVAEGQYVPRMRPFGQGQRYNVTGLVHNERGFPVSTPEAADKLCTRLMKKIECSRDKLVSFQQEGLEDAQLAVVCFGGAARSVFEAVKRAQKEGIRAGFFRPITIWPFPEEALYELSQKVRHIVVAAEYYLSFTIDGESESVLMLASEEGGMDIEETARSRPEKLIRAQVKEDIGLRAYQARRTAERIGLPESLHNAFIACAINLYRLFMKKDCAIVEINPLVVTKDGKLLALDAKINFDPNALFRHGDIAALRDTDDEDPKELEASRYGLSYVYLGGDIGCMVNGAGLAMATMDIIRHFGGQPANFLDVGGGASEEKVAGAFKILLSDEKVRGILINIFGGIMKCDTLAAGIIAAARQADVKVPVVVRLEGTNAEKGKALLEQSGLNLISCGSFRQAAELIVNLTRSEGGRI